MGDSKTTTTFTVAVTEKQLERIDREAERDRRNRSNFIKSIVLPEIEGWPRTRGDRPSRYLRIAGSPSVAPHTRG